MRKQLFKEDLYLLLLILLATGSSLESVQTDDLVFLLHFEICDLVTNSAKLIQIFTLNYCLVLYNYVELRLCYQWKSCRRNLKFACEIFPKGERGASSISEFPYFITCSFLHKNYVWRLDASSGRDAFSIRHITVHSLHEVGYPAFKAIF